jgi:UDP-N-acetylmuramoyl-tripeptide--D-alanyl-D-alanine ligase
MKIEELRKRIQLLNIQGFTADSRTVNPGDLFFALPGEKTSGLFFLEEAQKKGAKAALVPLEYEGESFGLELLYVADVLKSLQALAQEVFKEKKGCVIGVTGSVGKTTTKEFIATLLEEKYRVGKTSGTHNTQITLPLSLLNMKEPVEIFVLEMSMSGAGHIANLVEIAPPEIAVITKIGRAHAEFFERGIEGIAAAKAEIFAHARTKEVIVPGSSLVYSAFEALKEKTLFGGEEESFDYVYRKENEGIVILERGERSPVMNLPFSASHFCENFCAAVATARKLGLSWGEIAAGVPRLKLYKMRFERIEKEGIIFINDAYNASPESMKAALSNLPKAVSGRKRIAVFGEMKELGVFSAQAHREVAEHALPRIDYLLCYGRGCAPMVEYFSQHKRPVEFFEDFAQLRTRMRGLAREGDLVLLKGANSNQLWRLLED